MRVSHLKAVLVFVPWCHFFEKKGNGWKNENVRLSDNGVDEKQKKGHSGMGKTVKEC